MSDAKTKQPEPVRRNRIIVAVLAGAGLLILAVTFLRFYDFESEDAYYGARDAIRAAQLDNYIKFDTARVNVINRSITLENVSVEDGGADFVPDLMIDAVTLSDVRQAGRDYEAATLTLHNVRLPVRAVVDRAMATGLIHSFDEYPGRLITEAALLGMEEVLLNLEFGFDFQRREGVLEFRSVWAVEDFYSADMQLIFHEVDDRLFSSTALSELVMGLIRGGGRPRRALNNFFEPLEARLDDLSLAEIRVSFEDRGYFEHETFLSRPYHTSDTGYLGDRLNRDALLQQLESADFPSRDAAEITDAILHALRPSGRLTIESGTDRPVVLYDYRDGRLRASEDAKSPGNLVDALRIRVSN